MATITKSKGKKKRVEVAKVLIEKGKIQDAMEALSGVCQAIEEAQDFFPQEHVDVPGKNPILDNLFDAKELIENIISELEGMDE